jgi:hypothetical protein
MDLLGKQEANRSKMRQMEKSSLLYVAFVAVLVSCGPRRNHDASVRIREDAIEFSAVVSQKGFEANKHMPGYHFIVWDGGRSANHSLFRTAVTDVQVIDALESLGAIPGNALRTDTWDERENAQSNAPDKTIEGPRIEIQVLVPGRDEPLTMEEILEDPGGKGFDMRFGGHRANIPEWKSGCVVCLYSCPGSKVGNASYTVRDFVKGTTRFRLRPGALPEDGTEVTIVFQLVGAGP